MQSPHFASTGIRDSEAPDQTGVHVYAPGINGGVTKFAGGAAHVCGAGQGGRFQPPGQDRFSLHSGGNAGSTVTGMKDSNEPASRREAEANMPFEIDPASVRTEYELLHLMRRLISRYGFAHFMIARLPLADEQRFSERLVLSNWPAELVQQYDAGETFQTSELVERLRQTKLPVTGGPELMEPAGKGAGKAAFIRLPPHAGMGHFAVLLHTTYGEPFVAVLSGTRDETAGAERATLYLALLQLFECLERTFDAGSGAREKLSSREVECLRWAAAGKSSDEIAIILGISAYTVSSYFKSATRKLDAVNRMQAIARAMRMKLI
ncbi:helix-turn-helix transcriptional regulator [Sinorhizobium meliloti]|uniref:helix-turn-helix transcriptional regulator n=1 Tax=Rhizobium meliloti TaxID=382 RepID=UPI0013E3CD0E|nr:LuxR family transcriptional regulator [Sinorhizobium meliloti]